MNPNQKAIHKILKSLLDQGVREFCVCPGARNAPIVSALKDFSKEREIKTYYFFEERSASFFALGRIQQTSLPVGVVTTSGTAVAELLPATMEAFYSEYPLILLTADRPRRYRGSGAPQTAEQAQLFGIYTPTRFDFEAEEDFEFHFSLLLSHSKPVHINICFDEPLLDHHPIERSVLVTGSYRNFNDIRYPLIIVGGLRPSQREEVLRVLLKWGAPVYLEALSGLREEVQLKPFQIHFADQIMQRSSASKYPIDGVVRIGAVPTLRFWRDLDTLYPELPVLSFSCQPFSGLGRPSQLFHLPAAEFKIQLEFQNQFTHLFQRWVENDAQRLQCLQRILTQEPHSEPSLIASLSQQIPAGARIFLGNSLPIREWDLVATRDQRSFVLGANRGLNGIDGQMSTFFGFSREHAQNWCLLGDLTALYDLSAPWILEQLKKTKIQLVIINNKGGKIFSRMFPDPEFQNQHQLRFEPWAKFWNFSFQAWTQIPNLKQTEELEYSSVIELLPDELATQRFWNAYRKMDL